MNQAGPLTNARRFEHEAMRTTFTLHLRGMDAADADALARECFEQIDYLESRLSRFIEGSDVYRINRMAAGETLYLSESCHECLLLAMDAHARTGGLFDITLGTRIEHHKSGAEGPAPDLTGRLVIHPDAPAVTCEAPGREIDLGGIGKGFALDRLKSILTEWDAPGALLAAGASSLLAYGPDDWPVDLTGGGGALRIALQNESLSASGTGIQGAHILHPWGPEAMPAAPCARVWVTASSAALAEIWSTALMLVESWEIRDFLTGEEGVTTVYADLGGSVERLV
jgi:thiamine biosynthesis lipoprotein